MSLFIINSVFHKYISMLFLNHRTVVYVYHVVGSGCMVGPGCSLFGSGCVVGSGYFVVGPGCVVGLGCVVGPGCCLVGAGCSCCDSPTRVSS